MRSGGTGGGGWSSSVDDLVDRNSADGGGVAGRGVGLRGRE